ncbi:gluconolaconase [Actinoplanes sp. ATCC 53533]|uniref:SMP-30/gluconolactonase/LRE family protein n=1 Tax=Actinoplanes sp. ATCC 53533 TaxID=1288362 RepID=UPI000F7907EE|nr:SMP-30/gluconolactonase/LRE family protein [Actinoplanes sp. ATCC 53533]RSM47923.1 gluconolaconase [Actinoplanes sp. ATCC 53533]
MSDPRTLLTGIVFGESPRWHDGRLWFADWARQEIIAVDLAGRSEVMLRLPGAGGFSPVCIDWLPDGRLLLVSGASRSVIRQEPDGTLVTHADLDGAFEAQQWNEIAVDGRGNAYLNNIAFDFPGGEFRPGLAALATPDGAVRQVADGFGFPNGMAVTPDDSTLLVAESYAHVLTAFDITPDGGLANRRVWATLGEAAAPDGICLDAEGAVWYADVRNRHCVRVREGGEVLQTVDTGLGCFSCALGGPDGRTLLMVVADWAKGPAMFTGDPTGRILALDVAVPAPSAAHL